MGKINRWWFSRLPPVNVLRVLLGKLPCWYEKVDRVCRMTDLYGDGLNEEQEEKPVLSASDAPEAANASYKASSIRNNIVQFQTVEQHVQNLNDNDGMLQGQETATLEHMDPLTQRPSVFARVGCVIVSLVFAALAVFLWWLSTHTVSGQEYDDEVYRNFASYLSELPGVGSVLGLLTISKLTIGVSCAIAVVAFVISVWRRRWWLLGQIIVYSLISLGIELLLKAALPRPDLVDTTSMHGNSAPSGHVMLASTAVIILVCAVPRVWRFVSSILGFLFVVAVGYSVINGGWHRPSDVVMSILISGSLALLMLACTRGSGMDRPGTRYSSPSIQIVSTIFLTAGVLGFCYGVFLIVQMSAGLQIGAQWTFYGAHVSAVTFITSSAAVVFGAVLALRQVTASPLSKIGMIGAPPIPPQKS